MDVGEDLGDVAVWEVQFLSETVLPGGFCPPADEVFAYGLEFGVLARVGEEPVREDVDVRVAVGGEEAGAGVGAQEAVSDGEGGIGGEFVVQGVCCHGVDEEGDLWEERG